MDRLASSRPFILWAVVCSIASFATGLHAAPAGTEIVNIASSSFSRSVGGVASGSPLIVVDSNRVTTRVLGGDCFATPLLEVSPDGTVAPGSPLQYRISVVNDNGGPLADVTVRMALDPGLMAPVAYTDGVAPKMGGGSVSSSGSYDPPTHTVTWVVEALGAREGVILTVNTAVRPDQPADSVVNQIGEASAELCTEITLSNPVATPVMPPVLQVTKRADRSAVLVGDTVVYTVGVIHAGSDPTFDSVEVVDILPDRLRYVEGSARFDGLPAADPVIDGDGRVLRFAIGTMAPSDAHELTLAAVVGPTARQGSVLNEALAEGLSSSGTPIVSNSAYAAVTVVPGPFRREAYLVGRVFVDDNGDGVSDAGEPGVPGALVLLENGRGARTDITGRWHIEGVRPGLHVVRVDPASLPADVMPVAAGADWAGDRSTRFIEARASSLVIADFPMGPVAVPRCTLSAGALRLDLPMAHLFDEAAGLSEAGFLHLDSAADWFLDGGHTGAAPAVVCDDGGMPAGHGATLVDGGLAERIAVRMPLALADAATETTSENAAATQGRPEPRALHGRTGEAGRDGQDGEAKPVQDERIERLLRTSSNQPAIISPRAGTVAERSRIHVEVLFPQDAVPHLSVNGLQVPDARIGSRSELPRRRIALARYVGLALEPGENLIEFRAVASGIDPATVSPVTSSVLLAGDPVELRARAEGGHWVADGVTPAVLTVQVVDAAGVPSARTIVVTVESRTQTPLTPDADPHTEGFQVRLRDGSAQVRFAPPTIPGRDEIRVFSERFEHETSVQIHAGSGSWRVIGLAEGRYAGDAGVEGDGGWAPGVDDGISESDGRLAVFASGPVGHSSRLTVSVDTDRRRDRDRLERDFVPDAFYPTAGDSSTEIDEAASQGKVFARIDGPHGWARWGDLATGFQRTELTRYDRRMTGASGSVNFGRFGIDAFATSADQLAVQDVFEADGSSGPFLLANTPVVVRSETVLVETRDRYETDKVLSRQIKRRDIDYALDPISGTLLFNSPIAAVDSDLNPARITVLYETRSGGGDQLTSGARFNFAANREIELGATAVFEEREGENLGLYGFDMVWRPAPGTLVKGEVGISDAETRAEAVQIQIQSRPRAGLGWELSYRDLDSGYANPGYLSSPELGSRRWGGNVVWQPSDPWRVTAEAFVQDDRRAGIERTVAAVDAERRVGSMTLITGLKRVASESPTTGDGTSTLAKAGIRGALGERWTAELIREQALGNENAPGYPTRTAAGVAYQLREDTRLFLRQELESGEGPERDRTVAGVEGRIGSHTRATSKYTLEGGYQSATLRALTGIETVLPLNERNSVNFSVGRIDTNFGDDSGDYTTVSTGHEYRAGRYLLSTRYEVRFGDTEDRHFLTTSGAFRAGEAWSYYLRERVSLADPDSASSGWRAEGLFGVAYRPIEKRWQFLARADHSTANGEATGAGGVVPGTAISEPSSSFGALEPKPVGNGIGLGLDRGVLGRNSYSLSIASGARLTPRQRLAASATVRRVGADDEAGLPSTLAHLVSLHYTTQVHERWTVGGSLRQFAERHTGLRDYGYGAEIGFLALRNLWVTGGYNFAGFEDDDFPGLDRSESGPFISLRFKFDERSLTQWNDLRLDR